MALSSATLATLIVNNWKANGNIHFYSPLSSEQEAIIQALADGVAQAVVTHLTGNGVVTVAGVQSGGSTAVGTIS